MRLYIKQKAFTWRDRFAVRDESGADRYYVEGEFFSWGKKLHVYEAGGGEAAFIRQRLLSFMPKFEVMIGGRVIFEVIKELSFFKPRYAVTGMGWRIQGDVWAHEYVMEKTGECVACVSKAWFTWGDSYELAVAEPADGLFALCVLLAIDCAAAAQQSQ